MNAKLTENPRDWLKFTAAVSLVLMLLVGGLARRGVISRNWMWILWIVLAGVVLLCALTPRLFRPFYRAGMTVSFFMGQFVGRILLTLLFLLVLTPLGLFLRLLGKDLLQLKRDPSA